MTMAQSSSIEWTQATWNPVLGCRKVSSGCTNCYAERMSRRLAAMARADTAAGRNPGKKAGYLHVINRRGRWNGDVYLDEDSVEAPLSWRAPRTIFVNSMSDLFHEDVPLEFIQRVFGVMNRCERHTFQVLTKRPERAGEISHALCWGANVWMGTSVENRLVTDRVAHLRRTGAQIKFLSVEPLLGPIPRLPVAGIDWVIVGGESGPGARPMEEAWVRQIRDRCLAYKVHFFFKQWGGVNKKRTGRALEGRTWDELPTEEGSFYAGASTPD
jgi:protein gp37